jgi:hypothetical protein
MQRSMIGRVLILTLGLLPLSSLLAQSSQPAATQASPSTTTSSSAAARRARARARRRAIAAQQAAAAQPQPQPAPQTPEQIAAQQKHDQDILKRQQAQAAATARDQQQVVKRYNQAQQKVQSEPRIQDSLGDQPAPGTLVAPNSPPQDPQGIHDAPGPAQTIPKPVEPTPQPSSDADSSNPPQL